MNNKSIKAGKTIILRSKSKLLSCYENLLNTFELKQTTLLRGRGSEKSVCILMAFKILTTRLADRPAKRL